MPLTLVTRTHGRSITEQSITIPVPATARSWLTRLLAGEVELSAFGPAPLSSASPATARALACPDLFLVETPDRSAREAFISGLTRAASERGERVLVLSPDPSAADRIVASLAEERTLHVVRALSDDENPHRPLPVVSRLTSSQVGKGHADQMKREAALTGTTLEAKISRLDRVAGTLARLEAIERERSTLTAQLAALESAVRSEFNLTRAEALAAREAELAGVSAERSRKQATSNSFAKEQSPLSKKPGFFARIFGGGKPPTETPAKDPGSLELERELGDLAVRESQLRAERDAMAARLAEENERAIPAEVALRRGKLEPRLSELEAEAVRLDLTVREFLPRRATPDDTVENAAPSPTNRAGLERELAIARTRLQELTASGPDLARRLLAETQIVVGTPGSPENDPVFRAIGTGTPRFDLLVLDHAEELTEPAFERLSLLAARWVLAGEAGQPVVPRPHLNGNGHPSRHRGPEFSLFTRLSRILDREPWLIEGERLVFRLLHLDAESRKALSREPVLDRPDVELGVAIRDDEPVLVEIAFPAIASIVEAKSFLFSQLSEVLLRPCGDCVWHRADDRLTACWALAGDEGEWVELEPGIRERITGLGATAYTSAVSFDPAAGWNEELAEAWLAARIPAPSASRFACLARSPSTS